MALGGEMHDPIRTMGSHDMRHRVGVAYVSPHMDVSSITLPRAKIGRIGRVGLEVEIDDDSIAFGEQEAHDCGSDESKTTGQENFQFKLLGMALLSW
jgi:hypothetical protein